MKIRGRPVRPRPAVGGRRRYIKHVLIGLAGTALVFVGHALWSSMTLMERTQFPLKTLRVESAFNHVSVGEIAAIAEPYATEGFFQADVQAIKQAVEDLPWVYSAAVRRMWPDRIQVTVTEEQAVARWSGAGLVNPLGQLFYPPEGDAQLRYLPVLQGPPRTSVQVMGAFRKLSERLAPLGLRITDLAMDARRSWQLTLNNGMKLTLGRKDSEKQLERFIRYYPGSLAARVADIEAVDLRYTNGFAVRWRVSGDNTARTRSG